MLSRLFVVIQTPSRVMLGSLSAFCAGLGKSLIFDLAACFNHCREILALWAYLDIVKECNFKSCQLISVT